MRLLIVFCAILVMTGCAAGNHIDYRQAMPAVHMATDNEILVDVVDERPYVMSRSKRANYVGTLRALYYNPFNVTTTTRKPLAADLQDAVVAGFERRGISAKHYMPGSPKEDNPAQRLLVLKIQEWKSDTYMSTRFDYDVRATVHSDRGELIGSSQTKGSRPITNFLTAGGDVLGVVINDDSVRDALKGQGRQVPIGPPAVSPAMEYGSGYDECMARVLRISDKALRLQAMAACDAAQ